MKRRKRRFRRISGRRPSLRIRDILSWADAFRARVGRWPHRDDGKITGQLGLTWCAVNVALMKGNRGLERGSSLAKLLLEFRGRAHKRFLPRFSIKEILAWAEAYYERSGHWPTRDSGPVTERPRDTWTMVDTALRVGMRGVSGASSLAQLLAHHRGVRNRRALPPLSVKQILAWVDAYRQRTGTWPNRDSGPVTEAPGETWLGVHSALFEGGRGMVGGSSLAKLLLKHRGKRHRLLLSRLTVKKILSWADAYRQRTGGWPQFSSGPIPEAPGDSWKAVNSALIKGNRGLPGGSSLARVLADYRAVRNKQGLPSLSIDQILAWADAYHRRTGIWPQRKSGPIREAFWDTWAQIDSALNKARRGLPRSSLARLLRERRGVCTRKPVRDGLA